MPDAFELRMGLPPRLGGLQQVFYAPTLEISWPKLPQDDGSATVARWVNCHFVPINAAKMKTTKFELRDPKIQNISASTKVYPSTNAIFAVPTLPAYAVSSHTIEISDPIGEGSLFSHHEIDYDCVKLNNIAPLFMPNELGHFPILTIHYLGIRDYKLLFPHIRRKLLQNRAAQFMEEADKAFESGSWLAFVMMAGAVFECLLVDKTNNGSDPLGKLVKLAKRAGLLECGDPSMLELIVEARNKIHAGRFSEKFVSRSDAMQIKLFLDEQIKRPWAKIRTRL